jgi:hypothetical protein
MVLRMAALKTLVSLGNGQSCFLDSVQVLFACLGEFLGSPYALVDVSSSQKPTQFQATFCTTVTQVCLVEVILGTANKIYRHVYMKISFF